MTTSYSHRFMSVTVATVAHAHHRRQGPEHRHDKHEDWEGGDQQRHDR